MRVESQLRKSRQKARLVSQHGSGVMIGMPSLPIRKNHHARTHLADYACHFKPILPGIFDAAIGNIESAPPACAENPCCIGGLAGAILCRAARPPMQHGFSAQAGGALSI